MRSRSKTSRCTQLLGLGSGLGVVLGHMQHSSSQRQQPVMEVLRRFDAIPGELTVGTTLMLDLDPY